MMNLKAVVKFHSDKTDFSLFITILQYVFSGPFLQKNPYLPLDS